MAMSSGCIVGDSCFRGCSWVCFVAVAMVVGVASCSVNWLCSSTHCRGCNRLHQESQCWAKLLASQRMHRAAGCLVFKCCDRQEVFWGVVVVVGGGVIGAKQGQRCNRCAEEWPCRTGVAVPCCQRDGSRGAGSRRHTAFGGALAVQTECQGPRCQAGIIETQLWCNIPKSVAGHFALFTAWLSGCAY